LTQLDNGEALLDIEDVFDVNPVQVPSHGWQLFKMRSYLKNSGNCDDKSYCF
jgi:hypothetical protein